MVLWDYRNIITATPAVQALSILSSLDGTNFTLIPGAPTVFTQPSSLTIVGESFTFAPLAVNFVRFDITSTYGATTVGLNEVLFNSAPPPAGVPELDPERAFLPLLLLGSLWGVLLQRRPSNPLRQHSPH